MRKQTSHNVDNVLYSMLSVLQKLTWTQFANCEYTCNVIANRILVSGTEQMWKV